MSARVYSFSAPHPRPSETIAVQFIAFPDGRVLFTEYGSYQVQQIVERWWLALSPEQQERVERLALIPAIGLMHMEREVFFKLPPPPWAAPLMEGL